MMVYLPVQAQLATVELTSEDSHMLFKWNLIAGLVQLATSVVLFALSAIDEQKVALFSTYTDPDDREEPGVLWAPEPNRLYQVNVGYFSAVFLLLSAIDHLLVCTVLRRQYDFYLMRAMNPFRWLEYSVSASLMHIMIGILSGVLTIHLILAIGFLTGTTMLFGLLQEIFNSSLQGQPKKKSLLPFWLGCVPHMANWGFIMSYFFYGVANGDDVPNFVWAIIFILFFIDATFAIAQYVQQKEIGKFKSYIYGEMAFIILSLTSKQILAWVNYGGTQSLEADG
eukprot:TRINITY_DN12282_c0_g1_i12.p3 TRINITY_DN12282_c0_g1~~TRINITY_DN12282_c0_g1_i12.p3  ORF type:complete len:282 (+),score=66.89 TRINITY_DN12282_c0_g1_i12:169-1014(+)